MAKKTAGEQWHGIDAEKPKSPLKTSVEIAEAQKAVEKNDWKFPPNLIEATAMLKSVSARQVNSEEEWEALQPKLKALKLHVNKLQLGLPVTETKSTDFDHTHMMGVMREMQLAQLVLTNPLIKDLVDELAAAKLKILELTKTNE